MYILKKVIPVITAGILFLFSHSIDLNAAEWTNILDSQTNSYYTSLITFNDKEAALLYNGFISTSGKNRSASFFMSYSKGRWSTPFALDYNFPTYPSSYGPLVKSVYQQALIKMPKHSRIKFFASVKANYSTSKLNKEGILGAIFVKPFYKKNYFGRWTRISPVGLIGDPEFAVDSSGIIWFVYKTSNNLVPGNVYLSYYNPQTGEIGEPEVIDTSSMKLTWHSLKIAIDDNETIYVTYRAVDGLFLRYRSAEGRWEDRIQIIDSTYPPGHDMVYTNDTVWVVTHNRQPVLYRLECNQFILENDNLFSAFAKETDTFIEDTSYSYSNIAALEDGTIAVGAAEYYHYEDFNDPSKDIDEQRLVVIYRQPDGTYSDLEEANNKYGWNVGNSLVTSKKGLWISGGTGGKLFVSRKSDVKIEIEKGLTLEQAIIEFINDPSVTFKKLDLEVGLYSDTAASIINYRNVHYIETLLELDEILNVGPESMHLIEEHVKVHKDVTGSIILDYINDKNTTVQSLVFNVGLDCNTAQNIIEARSREKFTRLFSEKIDINGQSLDEVYDVDVTTIQKIYNYLTEEENSDLLW